MPVHKEEYLQSGYFVYVGKVIALTVVQGGSGLQWWDCPELSLVIWSLGDIASSLTELTISDIPDLTVRMCLQEVKSCQSNLCA